MIELTPQQQSVVKRLVDSGDFGDATEVIDRGLPLVEQQARVERLRAALQVGIDEVDRGESIAFSREWAEAQFRSALERADAGEQPDDPDVWP